MARNDLRGQQSVRRKDGAASTFLALAGAVSLIAVCCGGPPVREVAEPTGARDELYAYVVNQSSSRPSGLGRYLGEISGFRLDQATGAVGPISGSPFPTDVDPQGMTLDPHGRFAYVPNRCVSSRSGSVSGYRIDRQTGALSEIPGSPFVSQMGLGFFEFAPGGDRVFLGGDSGCSAGSHHYVELQGARIDPGTGIVSARGPWLNVGEAGCRPRMDPLGRFVAACGWEMAPWPTASVFRLFGVDEDTDAVVPLPGAEATEEGFAGFVIDPRGRFLITHSLRSYRIDRGTGALSLASGPLPENYGWGTTMAFDSEGRFLYLLAERSVWGFRLDADTGALVAIPGAPFQNRRSALALVAHPSGRFLYARAQDDGRLTGLVIDPATGALVEMAGSPFLLDDARRTSSSSSCHSAAVAIDDRGEFLFAPNCVSNSLDILKIDARTGALTRVPGSPFPTGDGPRSVALYRPSS
jgi:6-phosphogluconolactonase (cycloisomerase 2 family)